MELRRIKETMKELGLDRYYNPVTKKGIILANIEEMVDFAVGLIRYGLKCTGICYRANIFILNSDGTFTLLYNDFNGFRMAKELDEGFIREFAKNINDEDCVIIYETEKNRYAVVAQD